MELAFKAKLWEWQGQGAWCFISVPTRYYEDIRLLSTPLRRGFGSMRVEATIGNTTWKTSIFPDTKTKSYLLPVKKDVRKSEGLGTGSTASVKIQLADL